jgi:hypothetical protein
MKGDVKEQNPPAIAGQEREGGFLTASPHARLRCPDRGFTDIGFASARLWAKEQRRRNKASTRLRDL